MEIEECGVAETVFYVVRSWQSGDGQKRDAAQSHNRRIHKQMHKSGTIIV